MIKNECVCVFSTDFMVSQLSKHVWRTELIILTSAESLRWVKQ